MPVAVHVLAVLSYLILLVAAAWAALRPGTNKGLVYGLIIVSLLLMFIAIIVAFAFPANRSVSNIRPSRQPMMTRRRI